MKPVSLHRHSVADPAYLAPWFGTLAVFAVYLLVNVWMYDRVMQLIKHVANPFFVILLVVVTVCGQLLTIWQARHLLAEGKYLNFLNHRFKSSEGEDRASRILALQDSLHSGPIGMEVRQLFQQLQRKNAQPVIHDQARLQHEIDNFEGAVQRRTMLAQYIANTLIGLGLFGTFLGLIVTLKEVAALIGLFGVAGNEGSDMMAQFFQKMSGPLAGMGDAFVASLLGLGGSIVNNVQLLAARKLQRVLSARAEAAYLSIAEAVCVRPEAPQAEPARGIDLATGEQQLQEMRAIRAEMHQQTDAILLASSRMRQASEPLAKWLESMEQRTAAQAQDRPQLEQIAATMEQRLGALVYKFEETQQAHQGLLATVRAMETHLSGMAGSQGAAADEQKSVSRKLSELTAATVQDAELSRQAMREHVDSLRQGLGEDMRQLNEIMQATLSDKAGNSSATSLSMGVDLTVPAAIGAVLVPSVQTSYRTFAVPDILGATNRHNLSPGESADLTGLLNFGMDARAFLPTIRAISMDWGGSNITGDANTTSSSLRSVVSFAGINSGDIFLMGSQGGSGVRSGNFSLSIPSPGKLSLNASGTFTTPGADLFENKPRGPSASFDVGNIQFLYQVTTNNPSSMPTINISYDGRQASTGDMLALYEGSKLLGSRILTDGDVGRANVTLGVTVEASLAAGDHVITPKFIDMAGNTVNARDITFTSVPGTVLPTLSNLRVSGESGVAQALNDSPTQYAVITELPTNANGLPPPEQNLTFSGTVGKAGSGDNYAITVVMGNRIMAFGQFAAGDFSLSAPANILAPGLYRDVAIAATNITDGINNGQITRTKDQLLGWYWLPQNLQNINGGAGDDVIPLGVTAGGVDTVIQTGAGKDTLVVGAYGNPNTSRLAATVTDFFLGQDKVSIFGQTVTRANLDSYVTASSFKGTSTKLVIDLDGAGPGTTTYSLYLQNLPYHPNNVPTIFGV